jgi:protein O-mannosyl-transferase
MAKNARRTSGRQPAPAPARRWATPASAWMCLALGAAGLVAFSNSLTAPFVLDDQSSVLDNPTIRHLWPLTDALRGPVQFPTAGRPLVNLSLAINYALGGESPVGYHAWNLAVHVLCALLLFGIVRRTAGGSRGSGGSTAFAFACALLWLVHPLQSEVVDYVTQRTESMMGLCYFLTLYASIRGFQSAPHRTGWFVLAILSCAAGMACKESMVTAPLMVLLYDAVFSSGSVSRAMRGRTALYGGLAATWIVLAILAVSGPRSHSAGFSSGVDAWTYFLNQAPIVARYLRLMVWPTGLVLDYGLPRPLTLRDVWPAAAPILILVGLTAAAWRRHREIAFLGTWFFVTLAPTSSIIPIATEVGAERRMYLPLGAGVVLLAGAISLAAGRVADWSGRRPQIRAALAAVLVLASGLLIVLTVRRNLEYREPPRVIWQTILDRYPQARAHYNLGVLLRDGGQRASAIREFQIALPELPDAEYALGFELAADGKHDEAIGHLTRYVALRPDDVNVIRAYNLLGRELAGVGKLDEAEQSFRRVLRMQPKNVDALAGLADSLLRQERLDEAISAYENYVRMAPPNATAYFNLGLSLARRQRDEEAVAAFARAIALNPLDPGFHANLASSLAATGRGTEAIEAYRRAAAIESDPGTRAEIAAIVRQLEAKKQGAR